MKRNVGNVDRVIRTFVVAPVAIFLAVVVFQLGTIPSIIGLVVAGIMLVSSALAFCPTYVLLGISTYHPRAEASTLRTAAQH
jgi:hypothetical protein